MKRKDKMHFRRLGGLWWA